MPIYSIPSRSCRLSDVPAERSASIGELAGTGNFAGTVIRREVHVPGIGIARPAPGSSLDDDVDGLDHVSDETVIAVEEAAEPSRLAGGLAKSDPALNSSVSSGRTRDRYKLQQQLRQRDASTVSDDDNDREHDDDDTEAGQGELHHPDRPDFRPGIGSDDAPSDAAAGPALDPSEPRRP